MQLNDPTLFRQQCYIDGAWCDADSGETIDVRNPADGATLGTIPRMGARPRRGARSRRRKRPWSIGAR